MAARNATKAAKAATQDNAEKPQEKPANEQQAPITPPAEEQGASQMPPPGEAGDGAPSDKTADYVHADGFILNEDGDVVDADGLALPPVFEGEDGAALVLLSLVKACMPAIEPPAIVLGTVAEQFDQQFAEEAARKEGGGSLKIEGGFVTGIGIGVDDSDGSQVLLSRSLQDVMAERARQVTDKGYTPERDAHYQNGELAMGAACYAVFAAGQQPNRSVFSWPFATAAFRPRDKRRAMVKAAALLLAAIEAHDLAEADE